MPAAIRESSSVALTNGRIAGRRECIKLPLTVVGLPFLLLKVSSLRFFNVFDLGPQCTLFACKSLNYGH